MILIYILAIFGLNFAIRQTSGPYGSIAWLRNKLMSNRHLGVLFYQLLECSFCSGFWCGIVICLLQGEIHINQLIVWGLAGATISLILDATLTKLWYEK